MMVRLIVNPFVSSSRLKKTPIICANWVTNLEEMIYLIKRNNFGYISVEVCEISGRDLGEPNFKKINGCI